jgi:phosphoglycolate phosphatase-like HAD superfamily hydrolase
MWLVLFDVDGTLFLTDDRLATEAGLAAAHDVYGVELPPDCVSQIDHPGRTSLSIIREVLLRAELAPDEVDRGLPRWCERNSERYVALLERTDTGFWETSPGAAETLAALGETARLALLTGNPEPVAWARLERLGLARFFPRGQGAFGCEAEERRDLVRLARERAGSRDPWPAETTVLVGDTPRDVEGAHAAGIRAVGLVNDRFGARELRAADALVSRLPDLPAALAALDGSANPAPSHRR